MDEHRAVKVTPDRYLTYRYAGASGDFNPIHLDDEFARSVGLPGRILHGLWTMAQVARAQTEAAGDPLALRASRSSSAASACPRRRSPITSETGEDGTITSHAEQNGKKIVKGGKAKLARRLGGVLTPRQELLLRKVVEGFATTGQPVGSKALAADPDITCGPSTIRNELAVLEELRAARAPAHVRGARADRRGPPLLRRPAAARGRPAGLRPAPGARAARGRRGDARDDRDALAGHGPARDRLRAADRDATIRHIEVLVLQPQVLMVVIITSTGGVSKRMFGFDRPVDPGLADWAASYLNERLVGIGSAPARCAPGSPTRRCRRPSARSWSSSRPPSPSWPRPPTRRCTSTAPRG